MALALSAQACMPPGITHGPRVRDGVHVAGTYVQLPVENGEVRPTVALAVRTASETRRHRRLGRQFGLLLPLPELTRAFEEDEDGGRLYLLTGEYYQETDHPNHERFPRGWGVQASLLSLAHYGKIGWYGERGGIHLTSSIGAYGGYFGVLPPEVIVWWPYVTFEAAPLSHGTGMFHLGSSVQYEIDDRDMNVGVVAGATIAVGRAR